MLTEELLLEKAKKLVETQSGWGTSNDWTNADFMALSEKIKQETGVSISHVTLKRLWGKVKYDSLPNTHTLDTLVQYTGYENWRQFKVKNSNGHISQVSPPAAPAAVAEQVLPTPAAQPAKKRSKLVSIAGIALVVITVPAILFFIIGSRNTDKIAPAEYSFSSKTVVAQGLPNSVVFDYDATKSPYDSVIIQQSWDKTRQVNVSKNDKHHTSIYYYPEYYHAKLIVGNQVVKQHDLLIKTDGWTPIIQHDPTPVYLNKKEVFNNGVMRITADQVKAHNIAEEPEPAKVIMCHVEDFGEIYSDDFTLEASLKNDYKEGGAVCQQTKIYILCQESGIWIPLCSKGCVSGNDILFTNFYKSGKQENLSAFGVDFSKFVKVRVESKGGSANIYLDDKLAYTIPAGIIKTKIYGIDFQFEGGGTVDYVKLKNGSGSVKYDEEF